MIKTIIISMIVFFIYTQTDAPVWSMYVLGVIIILVNYFIGIRLIFKEPEDKSDNERGDIEK